MPYPAQTDRAAIIATAYDLIERQGDAHLTLAQLAEALHIKAPSLYRHVPSRAALIQQVNTHTFALLAAEYERVLQAAPAEPIVQLAALLHAHRAFAHAHPTTYSLAFTTTAADARPPADLLERLALPLERLMAALAGPAQALAALRGALALAHGFAMLEINDQLRRGGDLTAAFDASVAAYLRGWQTGPDAPG